MRPRPPHRALAVALWLVVAVVARSEVVINEIVAAASERLVQKSPTGAPAKLGPMEAWHSPGFDDSGWTTGATPIGASYGGLSTSVSVRNAGEPSALYLRKTFEAFAVDVETATDVVLDVDFDDGFIAYLNGREVARRNMGAAGAIAYHDQPAFNDRPATGFSPVSLGVASGRLVVGENVLAIQVHDQGDATLKFDAALRVGSSTLLAAGSDWSYFEGYREPSVGIYDDGVGGGGGGLDLEWTGVDFDPSGWNFGSSPIGYDTSGHYPLATDLGGQMRGVTPSLYSRFSFFSSDAQNASTDSISAQVDYDDGFVLYLNGVEVARRNLGEPGTVVPHTMTATASHGARFESGGDNPDALETIAIDPSLLVAGRNVLAVQLHNVSAGSSDLVFSAVVTATGASNRTLVGAGSSNWYFIGFGEPAEIPVPAEPKDPKPSDWVELHNTGPGAVDIGGWSLSDREGETGWVFPPAVIAPGGYLVVLASGKDIPNPVLQSPLMHTDFRLNASGEFLGLYDAAGNLVSGFDPGYPQQSFFHSYGRDAGGNYVYFEHATPGAPNGGVSYDSILAPPVIDLETGFYTEKPQVVMDAPDGGVTVRYTTDGSTPTETNGRVHLGGVVGAGQQLREGPVGSILREGWFGVAGSDIGSIPLGTAPGLVSNIGSATVPSDFTDNYATRIHGWVHPPQTGNYTFWVSGDDRAEVWLSDSEDPGGARRIAYTPGSTGNSEFGRYPEQQSAPVPLQGGARYYISILHKESAGADHLRVQWEGPGVPRDTIRGGHLSPVVPESDAGSGVVVIKARSFRDGALPSEVVTRSLAFGYSPDMYHGPAVFLSGNEGDAFFAPDGATAIIGGSYDGSNRWFASDPNYDYNFASVEGRPFEREATIEIVMPDGELGRRTGFGLRVAGSPHARPHYRALDPSANWLGSWWSKPSLNFFFRDDYGDEALDLDLLPGQAPGGFGSLRLRAGKNDPTNPFIKDEVMRRISWATGQAASRGVFCNMWINGHHKAYFNLTERLRESFFQRHYGTDAEWDIWHIREMVEGDRAHYDATMNLLRTRDMSVDANYAEVEARVDVANYIDYIITNAYGATGDWPHNNYNLSRPRVDGGRWTFNVWDAEGAFGAFSNNVNTNIMTEELGGSASGDSHMSRIVYRACKFSPEFRLLFADRVHRHFFNDGGMTQANLAAIFEETYAEFVPIYRAVRGGMPSRSFWDNWHPVRRNVLLDHFRGAGLWPETAPPVFAQHGGEVPVGYSLTVSGAPAGGTTYYTTDGSDPRRRGGVADGQLYQGPLSIDRTTLVKARSRSANGEWSALTEALFVTPEVPALAITEIHFNPDGDDSTEFVEIENVGDATIELAGIHFTSGLTFRFGAGQLAPGGRLVLVRDADAFAEAYPGVAIGGVFEAGALDNGGERLVLAETGGRVIVEADYNDDLDAADGGGYSLVLTPGADPSVEGSWVSEYVLGGTPGDSTIAVFVGAPGGDNDGDGLSRLLEYALGTDPSTFTPSPWQTGAGGLEIGWNVAAPDIEFVVEGSADAERWAPVPGAVTELLGDGRARTAVPVVGGLRMVRARCQLRE